MWVVIPGEKDTILYTSNPNDEYITLKMTLFDDKGLEVRKLDIGLQPNEMRMQSLVLHVPISYWAVYGSAQIEWESEDGITIFVLVKDIKTGNFFPVSFIY